MEELTDQKDPTEIKVVLVLHNILLLGCSISLMKTIKDKIQFV